MRRFWLLFLALPLAAQVVPGRYIVELSGEPAIGAVSRGARGQRGRLLAERRAVVRTAQRQARIAVEAASAEIIDSVDTIANALLVRIPDEQAHRLAAIPGVARVSKVYRGHALLDRAVVLNHVVEAWNGLPDPSTAGAGVKIGIIDSGLAPDHPGFQDPSVEMPAGYPLPKEKTPEGFEGRNKVIVARSYEAFYGQPDTGPRDRLGHGTAVAMTAAGVAHAAPLASISGVAPKAWLGVYRIFPGTEGTFSTDTLLKALDDAVADGMEIINLSVGLGVPFRPSVDPVFDAMERAAAGGVIVVAAAGNEGPLPSSVSPPASAPSVVSVGAASSDRMFATALQVQDGPRLTTMPGSGPWPTSTAGGPLVDVATLDATGLACDPLPAGSLSAKVALILRGVCFFEVKLVNAEAAGAAAALIYNDEARLDLFSMSTGAAKLPAQSLSYADGIDLKKRLEGAPDLAVELQPGPNSRPLDPNNLAAFSSTGPGPDDGIKPDLVAVGMDVYTATQKTDPDTDMYDASGYKTEAGTSFASPLVAGAFAVLKSARPGLTAPQYRSLVINSATPFVVGERTVPVQWTGAGFLNLDAAMRATIAAAPTSISFGVGGGTVESARQLSITNVGAAADTLSVTAVPFGDGPAPLLSENALTLDSGTTAKVDLNFNLSEAAPGEYQGFIVVAGAQSEVQARIPYWYAVAGTTPKYIRISFADETGMRGTTLRTAVLFQVTDASGIGLARANPQITAIGGGGRSRGVFAVDSEVPGGYIADVVLGPSAGDNVFQIQAGDVVQTFTIVGK